MCTRDFCRKFRLVLDQMTARKTTMAAGLRCIRGGRAGVGVDSFVAIVALLISLEADRCGFMMAALFEVVACAWIASLFIFFCVRVRAMLNVRGLVVDHSKSDNHALSLDLDHRSIAFPRCSAVHRVLHVLVLDHPGVHHGRRRERLHPRPPDRRVRDDPPQHPGPEAGQGESPRPQERVGFRAGPESRCVCRGVNQRAQVFDDLLKSASVAVVRVSAHSPRRPLSAVGASMKEGDPSGLVDTRLLGVHLLRSCRRCVSPRLKADPVRQPQEDVVSC